MTQYVNSVPETYSDQRAHILDETCWCEPYLADVTEMQDAERREIIVHQGQAVCDAR